MEKKLVISDICHRRRLKPITALVGLSTLLFSGVSSALSCDVDYTITNEWNSGAQINISINNTGIESINGYELQWQLGEGETFANGWNANFSNSGKNIEAANKSNSWNGRIAVNGSSNFGFLINKSSSKAVQVNEFRLNGELCGSSVMPSPEPSVIPSLTPTPSPSLSPSPVSSVSPSPVISPSPESSPSPIPSNSPEPAGITAHVAIEAMGKGFNLGQMFESDQHPRTFTAAKAKIDAYYALGHRNVRIPITWTESIDGSNLLTSANNGQINRQHPRLAEITATIDYALSLSGMHVVINAHHEKGLKDQENAVMLERLWSDIADLYIDRDYRLTYEILNEPHKSTGSNEGMDPAALRDMTGKAYRKIRELDPKRIILIGGNRWFGAHEMAETWPHLDDVGRGEDPYLMATFHHYNPWSFHGNHQGDYNDNWTDSHIYEPMDLMIQWSTSVGNNMPIYIGEWGSGWGSRYQAMNCNNIRYWYQKFDAEFASEKNQATAVWDDGGWFKIFDHATNQFDNNLYQCIDGQCTWEEGGQRFNSGCD
ncbi:cellulase family glycosylhydrolase [Agaribacterium sp. ZY112]|uniref:cellulase family glycosylhydrolase n=1 Tax=Agaribacterium sp. ZY112 TaxID=3233574 RepID=UPI003523D6DD